MSLEDRIVANEGVRLHCVSTGPADGPLVVFLHGFPARWSTWRGLMPAFAKKGYLAVAPDLRGYGASDRPIGVDAYSVPRIVEDVVAIVRAFGREKAFLVGHDLGGGIAWATAMAHPELVARLSVLNSVHPIGFERQIRKWSQLAKSWYVFFFLLPVLPEWWLSRKNFRFIERSLRDDGLSPEVIDDLLEGVRPDGALHAAVDWYRASFRDVARKRFVPAKVDVPTLVVWGDRERHLDPELATPPSDWVSNARIEHVEKGSHWVHHDAPERVAELVLEHFDGATRVPADNTQEERESPRPERSPARLV
jgi:pimeloyl-ACP methyl ester carboxylesterase